MIIFIFVNYNALVMKNKLWIPIIALLLFTSIDSYGQRWKLRRYEVDGYIGGVSFQGDIGLADQPFLNNFNGFRPSIGVIPRFYLREDLSVSLDLAYLMYGGKDKEGSSHSRVYSFNSHAFQHTARIEYIFFGLSRQALTGAIYNRHGMVNNYNKLFLYIFTGFGGVLSKAKVKDLNNGGEEPLNNPGYDPGLHYGMIFPLGGGFKLAIDPRWSIGVEMGYQFALTDWLDGYSSVYSKYNDAYYLTTVKAIYKIRNTKSGLPIFKKLYR